jgi:MFS-type transporter involved in bile tolerance (Atg22 family)
MIYVAIKAALSGLLAALVSEIAKRSPAFGALVASLPLISIMAVIWLWRDTGDNARIASHVEATFWYVIPSLPMFLMVRQCSAAVSRSGPRWWRAASSPSLYLLTAWVAARFGIQL